MPARKSAPLVREYIEKMSGDILEERYRAQLAELIRGHAGVYALYRGDALYYVGLAVDLMRRVNQHLTDHHAGAWNYFSVYLTERDEHIKPLESLLLRVFQPPGNQQGGKLPGAVDRKRALDAAMRMRDAQARAVALNKPARAGVVRKPARQAPARESMKTNELTTCITKPVRMQAHYKGERYSAIARKDGSVKYDGQTYSSLSAAASAITGRPTNGWLFWAFRTDGDEWEPMSSLR